MFYAVVTSVFTDLQLVTCGYQGPEGLQFMELLNVFEWTLWVALSITIIALAIILKEIPSTTAEHSITQGLLVPVKLLLEQGNPFPDSLIDNQRCRWISGAFLLMGIILSNAYKNTNVYNMIVPRKNTPYKHLQELINDSFTIYTRSEDVHVDVPILLDWLKRKNSTPNFVRVRPVYPPHFNRYALLEQRGLGEHGMHHRSEVMNFKIKQSAAIKFRSVHMDANLSNLLENASSLLPITMDFLKGVASRIDISKFEKHEEFKMDYQNQFLLEELDQFERLLEICEKTALVLPTFLGYQFVKILMERSHDNVYQGVETFFEMNVAIHLGGRVPPYLVQRARYAERCGLWKRWQVLFKQRYIRKYIPKAEPLRKPGMDGNIIVIFTLLISGLVACAICFGFETWLPYLLDFFV